jgi:hypothetical protein
VSTVRYALRRGQHKPSSSDRPEIIRDCVALGTASQANGDTASYPSHNSWPATGFDPFLQSFTAPQRRIVNLPARSFWQFDEYFDNFWHHISGHFLPAEGQ